MEPCSSNGQRDVRGDPRHPRDQRRAARGRLRSPRTGAHLCLGAPRTGSPLVRSACPTTARGAASSPSASRTAKRAHGHRASTSSRRATLEGLASRYFAPLPAPAGSGGARRPARPHRGPTLGARRRRRLVVPSLRVLTDVILSGKRRRFDATDHRRSQRARRAHHAARQRAGTERRALDLAGRIIAFTYEDAERGRPGLSPSSTTSTSRCFEPRSLVGGATLEVSWGLPRQHGAAAPGS